MNHDSWMNELLQEDDLADDQFTAAVSARLGRYRRLRRLMFLSAGLTSAAATFWAVFPLDFSRLQGWTMDPLHTLGALLVLGITAAFWVDTEPSNPPV